MICSLCTKRILPESEEFEEVGLIEFAHSKCVDERQESRGYKTKENEWREVKQPELPSRE